MRTNSKRKYTITAIIPKEIKVAAAPQRNFIAIMRTIGSAIFHKIGNLLYSERMVLNFDGNMIIVC